MTVLAMLVALFVERLLQQHRPLRRQRWFGVHCGQVSGIEAQRRLVGHPWGAFAALLPALLVIAWLRAFFDEPGPQFALAFTMLVLLNSLGPRDLGKTHKRSSMPAIPARIGARRCWPTASSRR